MVISSRTPEGRSNHCPVCRSDIKIEPSDPAGDAPCPVCGHLIWFTWDDLGVDQVITLRGSLVRPESLDALIDFAELPTGVRLVLDFSEVEYVSSAALGRLINLKKKVGALKGRLLLRHIHPDVLEVFRITRLDQVFTMEA